ncbi:MAG: ABC transporter substrate-binding protein [Bacteroidetes bacterium]|nr:ABC transporter substrate-binding protein [Bacteroidota bacterium]
MILSCHRHDDNNNKQVFRYNESAGITSLDPAFTKDQSNIWACNQLYNGLVQLDDALKIKPCIACKWIISDDGKTYTFTLRNDVWFHKNAIFKDSCRRVVAQDFVYSFNRIVDEKNASPGAWIFNYVKKNKENYAFRAINDSIFEIQLKQAFPPFLGLLSMLYCAVIPYEAIAYYGKDFRKNPVGTGPFQLKLWKEGVKLVLQKNEKYFEFDGNHRLPYLDAISITFIIDKQSVFLEFVKGNIDFMSGIDASYKDELLTVNGELNPKYKNKFQLISQPYLNTEYLAFLIDTVDAKLKNNPLKIKAVRQAINYGFDRVKMMRYLRNNIGSPALYGFIPKGLQGFDTVKLKGYDYQPDKSRKLLAEAGFPNGEGLGDITLSTTASYLDLCKYIQNQLAELGLKIKIDVNPPATLREMIAKSKIPFFRGSWIADYPDAENYLSLFYSGNFCPAGPNYTHFSNKEFDKLYLKSQNEINDTVRYNYYTRMDQIITNEAVVVVLYYDQVLRFVQNNIHGLGSNPMNLLTLKKVKKIRL